MELIFRMGLFCLSLSFYFQNIMDVRGKLLRHVLALQVESAVCALYGLAYGAITILPVDGVDSLHQLFFACFGRWGRRGLAGEDGRVRFATG